MCDEYPWDDLKHRDGKVFTYEQLEALEAEKAASSERDAMLKRVAIEANARKLREMMAERILGNKFR